MSRAGSPIPNCVLEAEMNRDLGKMSPFYVMDVLDRAKAMEAKGVDIVHLEVSEPDFSLHPLVEDAIRQAYEEKRTHYTDSAGDAELRDAVCRLYKAEYGVDVTPDRVIVTSGSSPALMMAVQAVCDAGEEILVSNPGYPCYRNFALAAQALPGVDVERAVVCQRAPLLKRGPFSAAERVGP